jgi:predicted nuclease of predicted toxin-antitoxin system
VKFLVDNQLPPALARFIRFDLGVNANHVADIGLRDATDSELWRFASENDLILISKDDDFVRLVLIEPTARLIWVRIGNCRRQYLLDVFRRVWPGIVQRLEKQDKFIEIR